MRKIKELIYANNKIFFSFCLLILSTVFVSFFIIVYVQFEKATYKALSSYTGEFLKRIDTMSNSLVNNIKESAMQMFYTSSIKDLRLKDSLTTAQRIIGLRDLGNFVSSSDILESVLVYNGNMDMIFSSNSTSAPTNSNDFPDKQAVDILTNPQNYPYLVPIKRTSDSNPCYSFLFYERESSSHNALLVNIKASWYESQLFGISSEKDYVIIDSMGNLIISNDNHLSALIHNYWPTIEQKISADITQGFYMPNILSTQPGYIYHKIQNSDWYYMRSIDLNSTAPGLISIRNFLFLSFSILSVFIIIFILYILIKVYFPFHYIKNLLIDSGQSDKTSPLSVEHMVKQLQESSSIQKISQLHSGILPSGFSFPLFMIIADESPIDLLVDLVEASFTHVLTAKTDKVTTFAFHACNEVQYQRFLDTLKSSYPHRIYVGKLCFSSEDLVESSDALLELRHLNFLYPETLLMDYNLLNQCHPISGFRIKDVSSLLSALKSGNSEDSLKHWYTIFNAIGRDHYSDFLFAMQYLNNQLNMLENDLNLNKPQEIDDILTALNDVNTLHTYIKNRLLAITSASTSKKKEHLNDLSAQINAYIHMHYTDDTFTAQQVADAFQMNLAYLNRQYKQSSDISISDAIHRIRIEQACILLTNTDHSAEMIAHHVGYSNTKYFFVLFKKWTNLTPKQYRTSNISTP